MSEVNDRIYDGARQKFCSKPYEVADGVYVRCQSSRSSVCPSCAELRRGDWARIARSGIYDADGQPVTGYRYYFITLTAPSFGRVHSVPKPGRKQQKCRCGIIHAPDDQLRGVPLNPDDYDYVGQVRWHQTLGRLWNSSVSAMRNIAPDLDFCAVREVQSRMAMHIHAIVRVPAWEHVTVQELGAAARNATAVHGLTGEVMMWGQKGVVDREVKAQAVDAAGVQMSESKAAARVIRYVSKALTYSLKDIVPGSDEPPTRQRALFVHRLHRAANETRCQDCPSSGPGHCTNKGHKNAGFGGHTVSVSRLTKTRTGWSFSGLTRTRLREERRAWMEALGRTGLAGLDSVSLMVSNWIKDQKSIRRFSGERVSPSRAP